MSQSLVDWATLLSGVLSFLGVCVAVFQIRKTRRAAAAAELAAQKAESAISRNVLLADVAHCKQVLEEVKAHVRSRKWESAAYRLSDARSLLLQVRGHAGDALQQPIQHAVAKLSLLAPVFEEAQAVGRDAKVDGLEILAELVDAGDPLAEWLGKAKYLGSGK